VARTIGDYKWQQNYIITEDHYIDYLSTIPVMQIVPAKIMDKLMDSSCLFLGYPICDWSLRVFLKRIWGGEIGAKSWAVEPDPGALAKQLWGTNIELYAADIETYVELLGEWLSGRPPKNSAA
jgi:hypothetical protein